MLISLASKCAVIEKLYEIHAGQCSQFKLACERQCAACCTRNLTLTTLEGFVLLRHLEANLAPDWPTRLNGAAGRFQPRLTLNELARRCAQNLDIPEDHPDSLNGPCPLLAEAAEPALCPVYKVRPFGCRAMVSQTACSSGQAARMPEFLLTLNHVLLQYIEGLDIPGFSGNLVDVLLFLADPGNRQAYAQQLILEPPPALLKNRPVSVLMIPPEHRGQIQPILQAVQAEIKRAFLQSGLDGPKEV